jgi:hypothetical protein
VDRLERTPKKKVDGEKETDGRAVASRRVAVVGGTRVRVHQTRHRGIALDGPELTQNLVNCNLMPSCHP